MSAGMDMRCLLAVGVRPVRCMGADGMTRGEDRPGAGIGAWPW